MDDALAAAASFLKPQISTWEYQAYEVELGRDVEGDNFYVVFHGPTRTSPEDSTVPRVLGNRPVLIDKESGVCRVASLEELHRVMKDR